MKMQQQRTGKCQIHYIFQITVFTEYSMISMAFYSVEHTMV